MQVIKSIALALSFLVPLMWAVSILTSGMLKYTPKKYLFWVMLTAAFMYVMTYAKFHGYVYFYSYLFFIQSFVVAIIFPLFYLYIYVLTAEKMVYNWKYYIHYVMPVFFFIATFLVFKIFITRDQEILVMTHILESTKPDTEQFNFAFIYYDIGKIYFMFISIFYLILIYFRYKSHKLNIINIFSSDENKELTWIKTVSYLYLASVVFNLIIQYMRNIDIGHNDLLVALSYFVFSIFFWFLGLYGYQQKVIYNENIVNDAEEYSTSTKISKSDIEKFLNKDKPYLRPDISIYDFCYVFSTNRTYLSESINKIFDMNFRTLINAYRVEEAKKIMEESFVKNKKLVLEDIATLSGFNNYSSFSRVFKSHEGLPPSDFINQKAG